MNEKTSLKSTVASTRIETTKYVINVEPRISATKLAEYIVADPARKETILKNAKRALKSIILQYGRVRHGLSESLVTGGISKDILQKYAAEAQADASRLKREEERWERADTLRSADALIHLATVTDQVVIENAKQIHRPQGGWGRLLIEGVKVSVQPDLVFSIEHRGIRKVGAIILNTAKTDTFTLERVSGRFSIGDYLTVLVYRLLEERLKGSGTPLHSKCFAVDVFRKKVYSAPAAHKTLLKNIEAACRTIAALWPTITVETDSVETEESGSVVGSE
jgi:hypothetical protein